MIKRGLVKNKAGKRDKKCVCTHVWGAVVMFYSVLRKVSQRQCLSQDLKGMKE